MVKKIVDDLLEEEYDDMYYSMRTKDDLDLYKKANWQRAVNLVLGMLMQAGTKSKVSQSNRTRNAHQRPSSSSTPRLA
jgi:hypothetical protein